MVWVERGLPARVADNNYKGFISVFLFKMQLGVIFVAGNIGRSEHACLRKQFEDFMECYENEFGNDSGLLLVLENATWHHKALTIMANGSVYYPPVID